MNLIELGKKQARKAIENTYDYTCDVIEQIKSKNPVTKVTEHTEETVLKDKPCRLSYKTITNTSQAEPQNVVTQVVKLFIAPELQIKQGSKIIVKKEKFIKEYENSGEPAVYDTHQEIVLNLWKGWA